MIRFFCALFPVFLSFSLSAKTLEKIHAVVNGDIITKTEIAEYQEKLRSGGFVNDLLFADPEERKKAISNREYLIKKLIDERIIDFHVRKNGFVASKDRIQKEIQTIAKTRGINASQLKQALKAQKIDYNDYETFIRQSLQRRQLVEKEITSKIKISDEDIVSYYLAQKGTTSKQAYEYKVSHILFPKDKKDMAAKVAANAQKNGTFNELVGKHSSDESSKKDNGAFGTFKSGEMAPSMEASISALEVGQVSGATSTPMGVHVFKLVEKKLIPDPAMEKAKPQIYQALFGKVFQEQFDYWLTQQRKDAIIQINKS